jgi:hypothetical protein
VRSWRLRPLAKAWLSTLYEVASTSLVARRICVTVAALKTPRPYATRISRSPRREPTFARHRSAKWVASIAKDFVLGTCNDQVVVAAEQAAAPDRGPFVWPGAEAPRAQRTSSAAPSANGGSRQVSGSGVRRSQEAPHDAGFDALPQDWRMQTPTPSSSRVMIWERIRVR